MSRLRNGAVEQFCGFGKVNTELVSWRSDFFACSLCVHTKVIVKGELVIVPNLNGEFRMNL